MMPFRPAPRKRKPRRICEALSPLSGRKPAHSWFSAAGEGCERIAENHAFRGCFWPWQQEIHCSKIRLLRVQEISKLRVAGIGLPRYYHLSIHKCQRRGHCFRIFRFKSNCLLPPCSCRLSKQIRWQIVQAGCVGLVFRVRGASRTCLSFSSGHNLKFAFEFQSGPRASEDSASSLRITQGRQGAL